MQISDIILCDDHYISLLGIETILRNFLPHHVNIRQAANGEDAIKQFKHKKCDLMILDLGLPGISGLEVIKSMREMSVDCKIVVMTAADDSRVFQQVIDQKVNAILRKLNSTHNLIDALNFLILNPYKLYLDPSVESILKNTADHPLTKREYEVLELIIQGLTSQEIALKLNCSLATIKTYRARSMSKSGARNSSELIAWFLTKGNLKRDFSSDV